MRQSRSFGSFAEFRQEILSHRAGPLQSPVDDMVDEMYHADIQDEFDTLWDEAADD